MLSLSGILFALVIFQLLFLAFFLLTREKGKRTSNILLGVFFLSIALNLLDVFLLMTGFYFSYPFLAGWGNCLPLLFGPLLYFYTRSVIYKEFHFRNKKWLHFLPFLLFFTCTEGYYLFLPSTVQSTLLHNLSAHHFPKAFAIVSPLILAQFVIYAILSLQLVSIYKKAANQHFSDRRQTDMSWLYFTLFFFIGIMLLATLNGLLAQTAAASYYLLAFNGLIVILLVFINQLLLKALRQPNFFSSEAEPDRNIESGIPAGGSQPRAHPTAPRTQDNPMAGKEKIAAAVIQFMQTQKPYLESELTLDQLATQLSLKPKILSQSINEVLGKNFFDFINHYRIEEARRLLTNPKDEKITILEVLYEVGFNSKSSFNTLFKKYTGLTPTEFRRQQAR
jgi:AraC-like DNA-binding protein